MSHHSRYYLLGAFALGITLTTAYYKLYTTVPEDTSSKHDIKQQSKLISQLSKINDLDTLKKTLVEFGNALEKGGGSIKEGVEGCIGDTPLIKIKSLSEYTGCEILAKAEVWLPYGSSHNFSLTTYKFLNGAGNSPKDRVALSIIEMVGKCQIELIVASIIRLTLLG
jgi:cysteine synthase A